MKLTRILLLCLAGFLAACTDDDISLMSVNGGRGDMMTFDNAAAGLQYNATDGTWFAKDKRVPLVGPGRVVDNISGGFVSALETTASGMESVVNTDLTDAFVSNGLAAANVGGNQLLAVKDMYRTYAGGQEVGFVIGGDGKNTVLSADVLKLLVVSTYMDDQLVETSNASTGGSLVGLDLLSATVNNGNQVVSIKTTEGTKFNKVLLSTTGVLNADVIAGSMKVFYAFVGTNPEKPLLKSDGASIYDGQSGWTYDMPNSDELIDEDLTNGSNLKLTGGLIGSIVGLLRLNHRVTVASKEMIPAGVEVGYRFSQEKVLTLGLFNKVELETYSEADDNASVDHYESNGLLGLSLLGGGNGAYSLMTTAPCKYLCWRMTGLNVDLGQMTLHYAYVREPVTLDPTAYYTTPETVETAYASYKFMTPSEGDVSLTITQNDSESPAQIIQDKHLIVGMKEGQTYKVDVTYTAPDGLGSFTVPVTITRTSSAATACTYQYLSETSGSDVTNGWHVDDTGEYWGVTLINLVNNTDRVLNSDQTDYASLTSAVNLLEHGTMLALKKDGKVTPEPDETIRVGFTLQGGTELLGLSALKFFTVKLYDQAGNEVANKVSTSNNGVSLGLINGSGDKLAVSVETDQPFSTVVLGTAGLLGVQLSNLRIYNAFIVRNAQDCQVGSEVDACSEIMTPANSNLDINYDWTKFVGINVGCSHTRLSNWIDGDPETAAIVAMPVSVGGFTIGATFDQMAAGQPIAFTMSAPEGVADVNLISWMTVEVMDESGNVVEEINQNNGLLSLGALGGDEKKYIEAIPSKPYSGIRVKVAGIVALGDYLFYGIYGMRDADGNGVPDCTEENVDPTVDHIIATQFDYHVCQPENLKPGLSGGKDGRTYKFTLIPYDPETMKDDSSREPISYTVTGSQGIADWTIQTEKLPAGDYYLTIVLAEGESLEEGETTDYPNRILFHIHPSQMKWTGTKSTDWNEPDNWSPAGVPWKCTDVLIPAELSNYPELESGKEYNCARIQFASQNGNVGEVVNTHYLNYEEAWVDWELEPGVYRMFSAPLKETYTGDIFCSQWEGPEERVSDFAGCWRSYTEAYYPSKGHRFTPLIYQRMWNYTTSNVTADGSYVTVNPETGNNWTGTFNLVNEPYRAGWGMLVKAEPDTRAGESYKIVFPKRHTDYVYYDYSTKQETGVTTSLSRNTLNIGRFIYEGESGSVKSGLHILLENKRPGDTFMAGNPFMAHINLSEFFKLNPTVGAVKFLVKKDGRYQYQQISRTDAETRQIAPMEGFLVVVGDAYKNMNRYKLYIHFNEAMLEAKK